MLVRPLGIASTFNFALMSQRYIRPVKNPQIRFSYLSIFFFLTLCCLVAMLPCFSLFFQLWRCPQLPFLLRSIFFSPVKYGCVQDDCNAAETTAMVYSQTKGGWPVIQCQIKQLAFRIWIGLGQLSRWVCLANRSSKTRREKHNAPVSA